MQLGAGSPFSDYFDLSSVRFAAWLLLLPAGQTGCGLQPDPKSFPVSDIHSSQIFGSKN